jgi:hypothetical protein
MMAAFSWREDTPLARVGQAEESQLVCRTTEVALQSQAYHRHEKSKQKIFTGTNYFVWSG